MFRVKARSPAIAHSDCQLQNVNLCSVLIFNLVYLCRSELHVSAVCNWKWKRSPNKAHELPEPIKTSLGRLVSRGMVPKDPPTGYTAKPIKVVKTGGRGVTGMLINQQLLLQLHSYVTLKLHLVFSCLK